MDENKVLRIVYTFFLGLLLAIFVSVGTSAFYQAPKMPEYPRELSYIDQEMTADQKAAQREYDDKASEHSDKMNTYNRNVSIITLGAAVTLLVISLVFEKRIKMIADGILLGGLFTLIYSIGRSFAADSQRYTFVVVSVGLAVTLYLGYHRFLRIKK